MSTSTQSQTHPTPSQTPPTPSQSSSTPSPQTLVTNIAEGYHAVVEVMGESTEFSASGAAKVTITQKKRRNNKIWCIHNGKTTTAASCPYTKKHNGLTCSMPHCDQPNGKFGQLDDNRTASTASAAFATSDTDDDSSDSDEYS